MEKTFVSIKTNNLILVSILFGSPIQNWALILSVPNETNKTKLN